MNNDAELRYQEREHRIWESEQRFAGPVSVAEEISLARALDREAARGLPQPDWSKPWSVTCGIACFQLCNDGRPIFQTLRGNDEACEAATTLCAKLNALQELEPRA